MDLKKMMKSITLKPDTLSRVYAFIALIVVLIEVGRLSYHEPIGEFLMSSSVFSIFCVIPVFVLIGSEHFKVNRVLMLFCVVATISLILNSPVVNYMSTLRFCFFCGMLCLLSPLIDNAPLHQFRQYLWRFTLLMCQVLIVGTLALYIVTGLFGDGELLLLVSHPMMLSLIAAIVALLVTWRILSGNAEKGRYRRILYYIFLLASLFILVWGGARSAIIGFIISEIYLFIVFRREWKRVARVLLTIVSFLMLIVVVGRDITWRVECKFELGQEHNSVVFSRQQLWESRIEEFVESPIIGIGFANVTRYSTLYDNEVVSGADLDRTEEPGSSWLSVLSNTGIVGFLVLAFWNYRLFVTIRHRRKSGDLVASQYGAFLILFIVSGVFEGWILYAGSFVFFIYWLLTARITPPALTR